MYREERCMSPTGVGEQLAGGNWGSGHPGHSSKWPASLLRTSGQRKLCRPKAGNEIQVSPLQPHVLVQDQILKSTGAHPLVWYCGQGASLLRFLQFCDELGIPESERMPALSTTRGYGTTQDHGELVGRDTFHVVNGAEWKGDLMVKYMKKGAQKLGPPWGLGKCEGPAREPVWTFLHWRCHRAVAWDPPGRSRNDWRLEIQHMLAAVGLE